MTFRWLWIALAVLSLLVGWQPPSWGRDPHPRKVRVKNIMGPQRAQGADPQTMLRADGLLSIEFVTITGNAKVSAIGIEKK